MNTPNKTIYCTNCGVEITWLPEVKNGWPYCCRDCSTSLTCECAGLLELEEDRQGGRSAIQQPVI